jgi:hypothetical protein
MRKLRVSSRLTRSIFERPSGRDMLLDLTDEETLALHDLLNTTIEAARYSVSPRIRMLRGTLTKLRLTARVLERRTPGSCSGSEIRQTSGRIFDRRRPYRQGAAGRGDGAAADW